MLRDYFPTALSFLWRPDVDGQPFHDTPHDPGAATAWGCTYSTWYAWSRLHNTNTTLDEFKQLTQNDLAPLYRAQYWNAIRCSSMTAIGIQMFDAAVNCGPAHAAGFLQTVLGVTVDDQIGPVTMAAFAQFDPYVLSRALCSQREEFYRTRPNAVYFERGWDHRAEMCRDYVLSLLPPPPPPRTRVSS